MVTVEVLSILVIWMAIRQLRSKHTRQRQLRERTVKCVIAWDVIIKLDSLQSGSKPPPKWIEMNPDPIRFDTYACAVWTQRMCSVDATNVQCGCNECAVWTQRMCSVDATNVQCGCNECAVWMQRMCSVDATNVQFGRNECAVWTQRMCSVDATNAHPIWIGGAV